MKYIIQNDKIIINDLSEFDITQILECGQVFSFEKIEENKYLVLSKNKKAIVTQSDNIVVIQTKDIEYFINYFDLDKDYNSIKQELSKNEVLKRSIEIGYGIRILKQDLFETIISFVISANNNIPRIRKSIKFLRENLGEKIDDYYAFPTLDKLLNCDVDFFVKAGLGYRSTQLYKLLRQIEELDLNALKLLDTNELRNKLISLSGIGPKVADCILLFGFSRFDVFPVDTWIEKMFCEKFENIKDRKVIRKKLVEKFGNLSGIAQQYLFYAKRSFNV